MSLDWCKQPDVTLPRPDKVFFLEVSVENVAARGDFGQERYEKKEFQKQVLNIFKKLHEDNWQVSCSLLKILIQRLPFSLLTWFSFFILAQST